MIDLRSTVSTEVAYACVWIPLVPLMSASSLASTAQPQPVLQLGLDESLQADLVQEPVTRYRLGQVRNHGTGMFWLEVEEIAAHMSKPHETG